MALPASRKKILLTILVVLVLAVGSYSWFNRFAESTDDAAIEAHVAPIAAKLSGYVATVAVDDNQAVKQGDVLVRIDAADYDIALEKAVAAYAYAEANLTKARTDLKLYQSLLGKAYSRQQLDNAEADVKAAEANLALAKAGKDAAARDQANTVIMAPFDGRVSHKGVEVGQYLQPGQQLMAIVGNERWVVANFKETQLARMKAGQPVTIRIDAYSGATYHGRVDSIEAGTGARFSMFPPENATGNFVKVVQRVPVKIMFNEPPDVTLSLGPGMSVVPTVNTK